MTKSINNELIQINEIEAACKRQERDNIRNTGESESAQEILRKVLALYCVQAWDDHNWIIIDKRWRESVKPIEQMKQASMFGKN